MRLAVEELLVKFNHLIKEYQDRGMYSPMEQVCGRVKSISSILDKAQKKNIEVDKIEEQLDDIAGIRIICQFVEDIEKVADLIRNRSGYAGRYGKGLYQSYEIERLPQLPYDRVLPGGDLFRNKDHPRGDPDPYSGDEFPGLRSNIRFSININSICRITSGRN